MVSDASSAFGDTNGVGHGLARDSFAQRVIDSLNDSEHDNLVTEVWEALQTKAQELLNSEDAEFFPDIVRWNEPGFGLKDAVMHKIAELLANGIPAIPAEKWFSKIQDTFANPEDAKYLERAVARDFKAIELGDPAFKSALMPFETKGFKVIQVHRFAHALWNQGNTELAERVQGILSQQTGVDIHPAARLGSGLIFDHATGIVIGETSVVGDYCHILHGVTLGGRGEDGERHPKIGQAVFIGADAKILGNLSVGDKAQIGAGAIVVESVNSGDVSYGPKAKSRAPRDRGLRAS
ncbi:MAG: serine O-acetyltransferase [Pseudomonadota bacterium]